MFKKTLDKLKAEEKRKKPQMEKIKKPILKPKPSPEKLQINNIPEDAQDMNEKEKTEENSPKETPREIKEEQEKEEKEEEILEKPKVLHKEEEIRDIVLEEPSGELQSKKPEMIKEVSVDISEKPQEVKEREKNETKIGDKEVLNKYKTVLQENKNLTIKEFVEKLKLDPDDISYMKSISPKDAVRILVMIGLYSIPFGPVLNKSVMKKIGEEPQKITFQKLLDSITSVIEEEKQDKRLLKLIKNVYRRIDLKILEDPYQSDIQLKDYSIFEKFIQEPKYIKLAKIIGVKEENLRELSEKIPEENLFLELENEQIKDTSQIELERIQTIKDAIFIMKRFKVKPKLALTLSQNFELSDVISLKLEELKTVIKNSSFKIQESEYSNEELKRIQNRFEMKTPDLAYLHKVITELELDSVLKEYIKKYKLRSITDFNKSVLENNEKKTIFEIISAKSDLNVKIDQLKAYIRLSKLSKNFELNKALIENNFTSWHEITRIPLFEFQNKFITKATKDELKDIYYSAQENIGRDLTRKALKTFIPQRTGLDYLVTKSGSQTQISDNKKSYIKINKRLD